MSVVTSDMFTGENMSGPIIFLLQWISQSLHVKTGAENTEKAENSMSLPGCVLFLSYNYLKIANGVAATIFNTNS